MTSDAMLVIRIGAMGDIIHALPAVASLKQSFPARHLAWLVAPRWMPLLEGNPYIDELIPFERGSPGALRRTWAHLRAQSFNDAIDFQGLIKSALAGRAARPRRLFGFVAEQVRERPAAWLYSDRVKAPGPHRVEQNLQLAAAAGAKELMMSAWLPKGEPEGRLPTVPYVLTTPFAGWKAKEWPLAALGQLAERLRAQGIALVANVAPGRVAELEPYPALLSHTSSLAGLIYAVRHAAAVIAPDSGPLHLAAAIGKPGVALFGPTDPASHGPFGNSLTVLRTSHAATTYKREDTYHPSLVALRVGEVEEALLTALKERREAVAL